MSDLPSFNPREYQDLIIDHIVSNERCAVWAGMGMGKTSSTLAALDLLSSAEDVYPALITAPLRVARDVWSEETQKWSTFRHIGVSPIIGDASERRIALRQPADIYTINYENLPWLADQLGDKWPFKTVVPDEATKLKGFRLKQGTQRARVLAKYAHTQTSRFIELTGTPSPNGLKDLWGQVWFLDGGKRLGRSYEAFKDRWFQTVARDNFTAVEPLPFAHDQITEALRDLCISLNPADWFDLREPIRHTVYVDLPPKARAQYTEMEKRMFVELEHSGALHEVEAFNAASRTQKCLQLANGAAYVGESNTEWADVHDAKLEALESIIEEAAGMPVLVAYNFVSDRVRLLKHFKGAVDLATREGLAAFKNGKASIGIGHPASIGHGIDGLQNVTNIMVFFGHDWNLETYQQFIERIGPVRQFQSGHNRPVYIYYIVARRTVDELVMARRESKRSVQDLLLEAMKARRAA